MGRRSRQINVLIICVITASFIWLMDTINTGVHTVRINYPIRFVFDDSLYIASSSLPPSVPVNISGRGWRLLTVYAKSLSAPPIVYSVSNPLKATEIDTLQLRQKMAQRFPEFRLNFPEPLIKEAMDFELKAYKVVYLKIDSVGISMEPGFAVTSIINMSPSLLSVEGSHNAIREFPDSLLIRIPDQKIQSNYETNLPLNLPENPEVRLSHESVYVSFEVSQI